MIREKLVQFLTHAKLYISFIVISNIIISVIIMPCGSTEVIKYEEICN